MVPNYVKDWFTQRAEVMASNLSRRFEEPIYARLTECPGYPEDGLHLLVENAEGLELCDIHVWQNGISTFDPDFLESCFVAQERFLTDMRTVFLGIALAMKALEPLFVKWEEDAPSFMDLGGKITMPRSMN